MELLVVTPIALVLGMYIGYRLHASLVRPALQLLDTYRSQPHQRCTTCASKNRQPRTVVTTIEMELQEDGSYAVKR